MVVATGRPGIPLGVERPHQGVVVDHVAVTHRLVGVDDVADLGDGHADPGAFGRRKDPLQGDRAGRIAGGEQEDLVAGVLQPSGQLVDDQLDPAVQQGRDGGPGWGDHSDAHGKIQSSRRGG